jgi:hypothetical protein
VRAAIRPQQQVVGEGAADINSYAITHVVLESSVSCVLMTAALR